MSRFYYTLLLPFIFGTLAAPAYGIEAQSSVEIRRFRYAKHKRFDFERLVLEFKSHGSPSQPYVQTSPVPSGEQVLINIDKIDLSGVIPEAAINDSYVTRSSYLGPISISTDDPSHPLTVRVFLKDRSLKTDAFFTRAPYRLVLDVYPESSPRATKGRHILAHQPKRNLASKKKKEPKVICFPANAQLLASVHFVAVTESKPPLEIGKVESDGPVVCYPDTSQVKAQVGFKLQPGAMNEQAALSGPGAVALGGPTALGGPRSPNALRPDPAAAAPSSAAPPPPPPPPLPPPGAPGDSPFGGRASGSTLNSNGFNPSTPLGSKLGADGPTVRTADPGSLLPPS